MLISGNGSNLQALIDAVEAGRLDGAICAVISNRAEAPGLQRARDHGIPAQVLDHREFASRERFDAALLEAIEHYRPDLVILAGFMRILSDHFVNHFSGRLINIHPSLLPRHKGLNTHQRVLDAGDHEHGCSVHFVSCELDSGAVIGQARVPVCADDDATTLAAKVQRQEHRLYPACVQLLCTGQVRLTDRGVTYQGQLLPPTGLDLTDSH